MRAFFVVTGVVTWSLIALVAGMAALDMVQYSGSITWHWR